MNADLLFRNYYRQLCIYALHYINNVEEAEDVVQDCFIRLMEAVPEPANARAWLYTTVRNRCVDLLRRQVAHSVTVPLEGQDTTDNDEELQLRAEREARLWEAVDSLPPRCREVFLLVKRDGLTYREAALRLGISEKTVEHQVSKGLHILRNSTFSS